MVIIRSAAVCYSYYSQLRCGANTCIVGLNEAFLLQVPFNSGRRRKKFIMTPYKRFKIPPGKTDEKAAFMVQFLNQVLQGLESVFPYMNNGSVISCLAIRAIEDDAYISSPGFNALRGNAS
ncbi:hypothetical protein J3R30DRAFT_3404133 [Lentinula aciculospora]|uniref:Uncharacterized protein n=1 Tax=Lentinula aciculospora TaxID=153920 RepID=A0A9W9AC39_9AGAR|nr:hypothetical protein J3R30DRAFT_3404133 [Lentinula aciculospora]